MAKWWILTFFGTDLESGQNILKPLYHLIKVVSSKKRLWKNIFSKIDTILKSGKNDQFAIAISREPINDGLFGGIDFKQNWTKNDSRTKREFVYTKRGSRNYLGLKKLQYLKMWAAEMVIGKGYSKAKWPIMAHCGAELIERKTIVILAKYIYIESAIIEDFFSAEKGLKKKA